MSSPLPENFTRIIPLHSILALAADWSLIFLGFTCAIHFQNTFVTFLAAILIARTQLALSVLMHESAHRVFFKDRIINDFAGQFFAAAPLFLSMFSYRKGHLQHHRAPMAKDDPVAVIFGIADYPVSKGELAWRLCKDLCSFSYFMTIHDFIRGKYRGLASQDATSPGIKIFVVVSILLTNSLLFGALAWLGHPVLYLVLWILPAITLLQVFARVRAITEHAGYPHHEDQTRNARSIVRPNWQTFFFGPHGIHYHIEHHRHVRVPFYHLRKVHALLKSQGHLPSANLYEGYGKVLKDVTSPVRPG